MSGSWGDVKRLWNNAFSLSIQAGLKHNRSYEWNLIIPWKDRHQDSLWKRG